jgi:hypothetical protein
VLHFEIVKRTCNICLMPKRLSAFQATGDGYRKRACVRCLAKRDYPKRKDALNARIRQKRIGAPARFILQDARKFDRSKGFVTDITTQFIELEIRKPSSYCGETKLRMTLDRKDNQTGHTIANVVPACLRCNYLRRDMPYDAWLHIVPAVREAKELGLFGEWTARARASS